MLLWKQGYHDTGISDILKACNISKWVFYNYFESKESFMKICLQRYAQDTYEKMLKPFFGHTAVSSWERFEAYYENLIELAKNPWQCALWCLLCNSMSELWWVHSKFAEYMLEAQKPWRDLVFSTVQEWKKKENFSKELSAEYLTSFFWTSMSGVFLTMKTTKDATHIDIHRTMMKQLLMWRT